MQQPSLATQYCAHQVSRDTEKYFPGFITQFKYYLCWKYLYVDSKLALENLEVEVSHLTDKG